MVQTEEGGRACVPSKGWRFLNNTLSARIFHRGGSVHPFLMRDCCLVFGGYSLCSVSTTESW
jgi:hypothetical protein